MKILTSRVQLLLKSVLFEIVVIFWNVLDDSCDFSLVCDLRDFMWHLLISQVRLDFSQ